MPGQRHTKCEWYTRHGNTCRCCPGAGRRQQAAAKCGRCGRPCCRRVAGGKKHIGRGRGCSPGGRLEVGDGEGRCGVVVGVAWKAWQGGSLSLSLSLKPACPPLPKTPIHSKLSHKLSTPKNGQNLPSLSAAVWAKGGTPVHASPTLPSSASSLPVVGGRR